MSGDVKQVCGCGECMETEPPAFTSDWSLWEKSSHEEWQDHLKRKAAAQPRIEVPHE